MGPQQSEVNGRIVTLTGSSETKPGPRLFGHIGAYLLITAIVRHFQDLEAAPVWITTDGVGGFVGAGLLTVAALVDM
jgi:hypothetical protein